MLENVNKKYVLYAIAVIVFIIVCYICYVYFTKKSTQSNDEYVANRRYKEGELKSAELILFYVDWCPHCKTAKPEWDKVKEQYQGKAINGYTILMTEHNCTEDSAGNEELLNRYKIEGYPTIKLLKDNQIIEFDAKPTQDNLEQFLNTAL